MMKNIIGARKHGTQYFVWVIKKHLCKKGKGRWCFDGSLCGVMAYNEWYSISVYVESHFNEWEDLAFEVNLYLQFISSIILSKHYPSSVPLFAICLFIIY